jgi:hypothetical protein
MGGAWKVSAEEARWGLADEDLLKRERLECKKKKFTHHGACPQLSRGVGP